jgi:cytochrome o ubiquinol oxidase subunit 2
LGGCGFGLQYLREESEQEDDDLRFLRHFALCAPLLLLAGCSTVNFALFHPVGRVAEAEYHYTLLLVGVMMIIILPTFLLMVIFPLRYRKSRNATYAPNWSHSTIIEILAWGVPVAITAVLIHYSFVGVYAVNPYSPDALDGSPGSALPPIKVDVVTTDWQWFFIYPDQHIATIDDLVVPAGRRVVLRSVMNGFYIPRVAPMIDAMPGMRTEDSFEVDQPGTFEGFSTDFSGAGFSWMQFSTRVVSQADFDAWAKTVQANPNTLPYATFTQLAHPTVNFGAKPAYFSAPDPELFDKVVRDAMNGVAYPVPDSLTESVSSNEGKALVPAPASP